MVHLTLYLIVYPIHQTDNMFVRLFTSCILVEVGSGAITIQWNYPRFLKCRNIFLVYAACLVLRPSLKRIYVLPVILYTNKIKYTSKGKVPL